MATTTRVPITRLTFLIHPFCYADSLGPSTSMGPELWTAYQAREQAVAPRWHAALAAAGDDEAVVFHPCFDSPEARQLIAAGQRHLGDRFLSLGSRRALYTPEAMAALAPQVEAAFRVRGKYAWSVHDLRIAAFSWHYARDLRAGFAERGVTWDPARLRLRAMGESFEGCVTTWSTMVPGYLDCASRVEIDYELTVPDTAMLLTCAHQARVPLTHDVALYLFTDDAGRQIAHFKAEAIALDAASLRARVRSDPQAVRVVDGGGRTLLAPGGELPDAVPADLARRGRGHIDLLVTTGRGRGAGGPGFWPREAPLFLVADAGHDLFAAARGASVAREDGR